MVDWSLAHVNDRNGLIIMCAIFCVSSITVTALRFYARRFKKLRFQADDWTILAALVLVLGLNVFYMVGVIRHVMTGHSAVVNKYPVPSVKEAHAQQIKYGIQTTEKIAFGLIKISILLLWKRIFGAVRWFAIWCWVMIGIIVAWSLAFFFATVFQCGIVWDLNWAPIWTFLGLCSDTLTVLTVFTLTDVITDLIIIAMPVPMIWKLQMSKRRKIAISSVFLLGFFTTGAGAGRMWMYMVTTYHQFSNSDLIQDITIFLLWTIIELNVAMLCANFPTLLPIASKLTGTLRSYKDSHHLSLSWPGFSRHSRRSKDSHHQLSSSNDTHSTSSLKQLQGKIYDPTPTMHTSITTDPTYALDLEMQPPTNHRAILVEKKMSQKAKQEGGLPMPGWAK